MDENGHHDGNARTDPLSDPEERRVLHAALDSFRQYRKAAHYNITHLRRQSFYSLSSAQVDLLSKPPFSLPDTFRTIDDAIESNADLAEAILEVGLPSFGIDPSDESWKQVATSSDMEKVRSTIRQFYRDWSAEGLPERHASYSPILSALKKYLPEVNLSQRHNHRVLVPGAGLGRLVLEICTAGYTTEGNEISYHQLIASNYILNYTQSAEQHKVYPWALGFSNHTTRANQLQSVAVPDVHPATELQESDIETQSEVPFSERLSMTAADFCSLYRQAEYENAFDAVATCFFIDTAPNVISYIETIKHCLKPNGIWINLGPLLWHFESTLTPAEREKKKEQKRKTAPGPSPSEQHEGHSHSHESHRKARYEGIGEPGSFELSNDEVMALITEFGFEVLEQQEAPAGATGYIQDPSSMLQNVYRPAFWVAKKR